MRRTDLLRAITNEEAAIAWCQDRKIVNFNPICRECNGETKFRPNQNYYRCMDQACRKIISITSNTIFDSIKISIRKGVFILYEWCSESSSKSAAFEYEISITCVDKWYSKFRSIASIFSLMEIELTIGGIGTVVEIDESLICKNKYNKGRKLSAQVWVFGGTVR